MTTYETPEMAELAAELSAEHGFSAEEIEKLARAVAGDEVDPLPLAQRGARFAFSWRNRTLILDDPHNPYVLSARVPPPDADVDLVEALAECRSDAAYCAGIIDNRACGVKAQLRAMVNQRDWARFLAVRDPKPVNREAAAALLPLCEANVAGMARIEEWRKRNNMWWLR